jgi:DNA-binding MarR family transcriptional regulator
MDSSAFLAGKLGQWVRERFADRIAPLGIRPRHCGLLELAAAKPCTQLDLARALGVAPSVIVDMVDELEPLGAVRRRRDREDRRRQIVDVTDAGRTLIRKAVAASQAVDRELLEELPEDERAAFRAALRTLATTRIRPD